MTRSEAFFKAIDVIANPFQNYKKFKAVKREKETIVYDEEYPKDCVGEVLYRPELVGEGKPLLPVVINVHGGGFVKGDKHYRRSVSALFADRGYFVFNVNYRSAPKYPIPAAMVDCAKVLNYIKVLAKKYNIDETKVVVTGDSSGAHYAGQMAALAYEPKLVERIGAPQVEVKPALFVGFCGPYDVPKTINFVKLPFHLLWDIGRCYFDQGDFKLKKDFSNIEDAPYIDCSNILNWVNKDWCPSFLAMSQKDFICKGHGELLKEKLDELGVENLTYSSTKFVDNHCFHLNFWSKASKEVFALLFPFMEEKLGLKK